MEKKLEHLLQYDELTQLKNAAIAQESGVQRHLPLEVQEALNTTIVLNQFKEGAINFLPTYKYDRGTHNFDSSRKQRVPAWTDRILFKSGNDKIKLLEYNSIQGVNFSDHRPVNALF